MHLRLLITCTLLSNCAGNSPGNGGDTSIQSKKVYTIINTATKWDEVGNWEAGVMAGNTTLPDKTSPVQDAKPEQNSIVFLGNSTGTLKITVDGAFNEKLSVLNMDKNSANKLTLNGPGDFRIETLYLKKGTIDVTQGKLYLHHATLFPDATIKGTSDSILFEKQTDKLDRKIVMQGGTFDSDINAPSEVTINGFGKFTGKLKTAGKIEVSTGSPLILGGLEKADGITKITLTQEKTPAIISNSNTKISGNLSISAISSAPLREYVLIQSTSPIQGDFSTLTLENVTGNGRVDGNFYKFTLTGFKSPFMAPLPFNIFTPHENKNLFFTSMTTNANFIPSSFQSKIGAMEFTTKTNKDKMFIAGNFQGVGFYTEYENHQELNAGFFKNTIFHNFHLLTHMDLDINSKEQNYSLFGLSTQLSHKTNFGPFSLSPKLILQHHKLLSLDGDIIAKNTHTIGTIIGFDSISKFDIKSMKFEAFSNVNINIAQNKDLTFTRELKAFKDTSLQDSWVSFGAKASLHNNNYIYTHMTFSNRYKSFQTGVVLKI